MTLRPHHAYHALVIALGMALTACGSDATNQGNRAAGTDTVGNTSKLGTKAPAGASGPIYKDAASGAMHVRGDLLIQALLSRLGERDESGQPLWNWLDADRKVFRSYASSAMNIKEEVTDLKGPVVLLKEDVSPDTGNTGLGRHVYEVALMEGPLREASHLSSVKRPDLPAVKFGVSLPGMQKKGSANQPPVNAPLEIGQTLSMQYQEAPDFRQYEPREALALTLTSEKVSTIQPNEYYTGWKHAWNTRFEDARDFGSVELDVAHDEQNDRRFSTCITFSKASNDFQKVCDQWELPSDWRSGQPLVHLGQELRDRYNAEVGETSFTYNWNDRKGTAPVAEGGLKTTATPVNAHGVSGALLAAMFDAWTPRARGMAGLPPFASLAKGPQDTEPGEKKPESDDPDRISVYYESRASSYADGGNDAGTHSPAIGSYLHAFRSGVWKGANDPRGTVWAFNQITMAMHVAHDPVKGLTLPRWAGIHQYSEDLKGKQYWLYQGEQLAGGAASRTIAPNDLILFGSTVQYWHDPEKYSSDQPGTGSKGRVLLTLSVEKSLDDERSVDLCWTSAMLIGRAYKNCTTWNVPEGWAPGQALKPQSYYAATANDWGSAHWNTRVNQ